ncbi:basic proline-rich protein-like [Hippopotamus amphibius kiboko]|uniref:basic proline-rich protein-like n=1 Tax=Hippopotamus amphibius kiboko TaxID=575201 RepID=UPI002595739E|nr:basic proline-rich protein-like [Hippopotamus amphibius kiboko]
MAVSPPPAPAPTCAAQKKMGRGHLRRLGSELRGDRPPRVPGSRGCGSQGLWPPGCRCQHRHQMGGPSGLPGCGPLTHHPPPTWGPSCWRMEEGLWVPGGWRETPKEARLCARSPGEPGPRGPSEPSSPPSWTHLDSASFFSPNLETVLREPLGTPSPQVHPGRTGGGGAEPGMQLPCPPAGSSGQPTPGTQRPLASKEAFQPQSPGDAAPGRPA